MTTRLKTSDAPTWIQLRRTESQSPANESDDNRNHDNVDTTHHGVRIEQKKYDWNDADVRYLHSNDFQ